MRNHTKSSFIKNHHWEKTQSETHTWPSWWVWICYTQSKAKHRVCYAGIDKKLDKILMIKSPSTFRLMLMLMMGWMDEWWRWFTPLSLSLKAMSKIQEISMSDHGNSPISACSSNDSSISLYTHTKAKHRVWNVGNHKHFFTYDRKKSVSLRVMKFPLPYYYLLWGRGTKGREEEKFSARSAYIYTRKKCWENRPQNHSKKTSSHWATRPPSTRGGRASRGGKEKGEKEGVSLGTTAEFIPQKRGAGRAARSAARGRNRENSTLTAG